MRLRIAWKVLQTIGARHQRPGELPRNPYRQGTIDRAYQARNRFLRRLSEKSAPQAALLEDLAPDACIACGAPAPAEGAVGVPGWTVLANVRPLGAITCSPECFATALERLARIGRADSAPRANPLYPADAPCRCPCGLTAALPRDPGVDCDGKCRHGDGVIIHPSKVSAPQASGLPTRGK